MASRVNLSGLLPSWLYQWRSSPLAATKPEDPPTQLVEGPLPFTDDFTLGLTIDHDLVFKILSTAAETPTTSEDLTASEDFSEHEADSDMTITETVNTGDGFTLCDIRTLEEAPRTVRLPLDINYVRIFDQVPTAPAIEEDFEEGVPLAQEDGIYASWIPIPNLVDEVQIEVQVQGQSFFIAKDLLCSKSTYFNTALNSEFIEARTNKIKLVDRLDLFKIFYFWLKNGNLNFLDSRDWTQSAGDVLTAFVEIYSFSDRRGVPALGDLILRKLDRRIRPGGIPVRLDANIIRLAWDQLPETSGLCRYLLAMERDANKCNLPRRSGVDYECLSGSFIAALVNATETDHLWWRAAKVQRQAVDIAQLHRQIKLHGGLTRVDRLRKWDEIRRMMGIRVPVGYDQDRVQGQFRAMARRLLRPWDTISTGLESAEAECPRPLVREFFHGAAHGHPWW